MEVIDEVLLPLPPGRPAGQPIQVTYSYNVNQIMECRYEDVETGRFKIIRVDFAK